MLHNFDYKLYNSHFFIFNKIESKKLEALLLRKGLLMVTHRRIFCACDQ